MGRCLLFNNWNQPIPFNGDDLHPRILTGNSHDGREEGYVKLREGVPTAFPNEARVAGKGHTASGKCLDALVSAVNDEFPRTLAFGWWRFCKGNMNKRVSDSRDIVWFHWSINFHHVSLNLEINQ